MIARIKAWLVMAATVILAVLGAFALGTRSARRKRDLEYANAVAEYSKKTTKEIHRAAVKSVQTPTGRKRDELRRDWLLDDPHDPP